MLATQYVRSYLGGKLLYEEMVTAGDLGATLTEDSFIDEVRKNLVADGLVKKKDIGKVEFQLAEEPIL